MRKIFNILFALSLVFLLMSCSDSKKETPQGFVYLEDGVFKVDGETFFPMMLNYKIEMRKIGDNVIVSPAKYYENGDIFESNSEQEILRQFSSHVDLMKELGFNTIRICMDIVLNDDNGHYYITDNGPVYLKDNTDKIIEGIEKMVDIVSSYDMKTMLLLKPPMDEELNDFTAEVLRHFAGNPTIFAYDFMNEPLYFDAEPQRKKEDAVAIVKKWNKMVRKYAPHHLFTIGFAEPIEVFEWDPSMLPVDFVQIHTYHPLRIPNEIWWYSHYVGKPWMIGETSLPADNDSISYDSQARFVEQVYRYTIDCGGIGFGWWEFQEYLNSDLNFEANYTGLLNHDGVTVTKNGNEILGTLKPAAFEFAKLHELKPKTPVRADNYFNMLGYENYVITGRIMCDKKPVDGAVIRGWNLWWGVGMNTYSDKNGRFTLYSNDKNVHFEISAPGYNNVKFDNERLQYSSVDGGECDFSTLQNVDLEYHKISYFPFLANDTMLFEFKPGMFDKAKFKADLGDIELKKIR